MQHKEKYTFALLYGDRRMLRVAENMIGYKHNVRVYGLCEDCIDGAIYCDTLQKAISGADVVILPFPVSKFVSDLCDIEERCRRENVALICGGLIPEGSTDIEKYDYGKDERLLMQNAILTARGAFVLARETLPDKFFVGCSALVCGFGRIGKYLSEILLSHGCKVTVAARRPKALEDARKLGCDIFPLDGDYSKGLSEEALNNDVIFNTVPHIIFESRTLTLCPFFSPFIELASSPGGIEKEMAESMGIRIISAPGIPGKYYPNDAGDCIFESIASALSERGIKL